MNRFYQNPVSYNLLYSRRHLPDWLRYLLSFGLILVITLIGVPLARKISPTNLIIFYLSAVVIISIYLGRGPALLASVTSVLIIDFFLVAPHFSLQIEDTQYLITLSGLLVVSILISDLAARLHNQVDSLEKQDADTMAINFLSRDLTVAIGMTEILDALIHHIKVTFNCDAVILLPKGRELSIEAAAHDLILTEEDQNAAQYCFLQITTVGKGTSISPESKKCFIPLKSGKGVLGVLGVTPSDQKNYLSQQQDQLLEGFAYLASLAIERAQLGEQASQAEMLKKTEKLQTALLNSISHDLRTPLASITGVLSSLRDAEQADGKNTLDASTRIDLLESAQEEADRLNRLVGNLLNMTRMEAGAIQVTFEPCDISDLIGSSLSQTAARLQRHVVQVKIPPDLPLVPMDFVLMTQVIDNLIDNATKYAPPETLIEISSETLSGNIRIKIRDHGPGIPQEDLEHVFDKFFRVQLPMQRAGGVAGSGLGLSISKGIVEAHGGHIWAENTQGNGTAMIIQLPLQQSIKKVET